MRKVLSDRKLTLERVLSFLSAAKLGIRQGYDLCLEAFSSAVNPHVHLKWGMGGVCEVKNETAYLYRHFDATLHILYLFDRIKCTN